MKNSMCQVTTIVVAGVLLAAVARGQNDASGPPTMVMACDDLTGATFPASAIAYPTNGVTITAAEVKPGTGDAVTEANFVPEFCRVEGIVAAIDPEAPDSHFAVAIPTDWNGRAIHVGGNRENGFVPRLASFIRGAAGSPMGPAYPPDRPYPIAQGYALFGSDGGHGEGAGRPPGWTPAIPEDGAPPLVNPPELGEGAEGGPPPSMSFDWYRNAEALGKYSGGHVKMTHDAAFAIFDALYGVTPDTTYFMGESQGGRDALYAAGAYGADYDGVLISVPLANFEGLLIGQLYRIKMQFEEGVYIPPAKMQALETEVLARCDGMDGLEDGVINNYMGCFTQFDPTQTENPFANLRCEGGTDTGNNCFSDPQIGLLNATFSPMVYGFPVRNGQDYWPANPIGGKGMGTGGLTFYTQPAAPTPENPGGFFKFLLDNILGGPGAFDYYENTHAELQEDIQRLSEVLSAPNDWSDVFAHGGKVIFHSAANDYLTNARSHMLVYDQVVEISGQETVDDHVRFYVTPNGDHGSKGFTAAGDPTPDQMDLITALTDWVENGITPPDAIEQKLMEQQPPYAVLKSRPLCRYPSYPHYNGEGDPNVMASYTCTAP